MSHKSIAGLMFIGWALAPGFVEAQPSKEFLGKNAQAWLTDLEKGNDSTRRGAAFALGKLEAGNALVPLQKRLQTDKDTWVREAAAFALGEIGRSSTNDQLLPVLTTALAKDPSPSVRRSAAYALGCMEGRAVSALPQLEAALEDKSSVVRQSVAWSLARLGEPGIPALKKALNDTNALVKRDGASSAANCMANNRLDRDMVRPLVPDLVQMCREDNSEVRRAALSVLIKAVTNKDGEHIPNIAFALKDDDEEVRINAALTLANIGGKESARAVPQLLIALRQRVSLETRRQAAVAIRNIGAPAKEAVPDLIQALSDEDGDLRAGAALALGGIGADAEKAYGALLTRVEDSQERPQTRVEAAYALSLLGRCPDAEKSVPRILTVLANEKEPANVRGRVIWALRVHYLPELRNMGVSKGLYAAFYKVLSEPKNDDNKMLRYDCAFMLGKLQKQEVQPEVLQTLLDFLRDDKVQIFDSKQSEVTGTGQEVAKGKTNVKESGIGDGRRLAVESLTDIGADRLMNQAEIITELKALAEKSNYEPLRQASAKLLKDLGK